ncbi:hypothetical protein, partial [Nocardia cyriacigeorgica]|uniref:hypothetical protein n=1 Tax=Nocardia cyriacigeorgica TaxID=135487 RepID=UPI003CC7EE05
MNTTTKFAGFQWIAQSSPDSAAVPVVADPAAWAYCPPRGEGCGAHHAPPAAREPHTPPGPRRAPAEEVVVVE